MRSVIDRTTCFALITASLICTLLQLGGCKLRGDGAAAKSDSIDGPSDRSMQNSQPFAKCTSTRVDGRDDNTWSFELYQDVTTERAQLKYWREKAPTEQAKDPFFTAGVWDNADERAPFERLYVFSNLSMIISLDRTPSGFNPATVTGKDATGQAVDQTLMCMLRQN